MKKKDFIQEVYKDSRTVYTFGELALLLEESDAVRLRQKINYYVKNKAILNIRRGIYAKENYNAEELACKIYSPAYLSLEYVLQKESIIFQYSEQLTMVSYLSRVISVDNLKLSLRKIKNEILVNAHGIIQKDKGINIATPERALLDMLYLNKEFYFDNLAGIDQEKVRSLIPVYNAAHLKERIAVLFGSK
jgi:hypothetical protein